MNAGTEARKCVKIVDFQKCGVNEPKLCELHTKCVVLGRSGVQYSGLNVVS